MHAWTRSLTLGAVIAPCLLFIGCAEQNGKPAAREGITPPVRSQKVPKPDNLPEASAPSILPRTYMAAGRFHETQGHYARALEQYQQAAATEPKSVEAWNRLGIVLDRMGRYKEADDAFKKAIAIAPEAAHLHNNLAFSYMTQARWMEAEAELYQAIQLKPDFLRARVNLGMVLAQRDKFDDAMTHFEAGLTKADALFNMGLMYQSKRKLPEAARSFHLALTENPKLVAAQKRLEMLPPEAAKAGKEMAIAAASPPEPELVVASVAPATRPAADTGEETEATASLLDLAEPVDANEPVAVSQAEPMATDFPGDTPAKEEPVAEAVASIDNTEAADLTQDVDSYAELATGPEAVDMPAASEEPVAKETADEARTDVPSGEAEADADSPERDSSDVASAESEATESADSDSTSPEREARGSAAATKPADSDADEPAESSDADEESTDVSDAGPQETGPGLVSSMLAGVSDRAETARAGVTSTCTAVKALGRHVVTSIRTADPYAEFLRMASPLALEVRPARAGMRPFAPAE